MTMGARSALWLCARQELVLAVRSRWMQTFAVVFAALAVAVAGYGYVLSGGRGGRDFSRAAAALLQLVLLLVPLTALVFGMMVLPPESGAVELLFSQPARRTVDVGGQLIGLLIALVASQAIGF